MVKKVAILTAGGFAPCLSSAIGGLIERYTEVAPEVEIIAYRHGYQGLLKGDFLVVDDTVRANAALLHKFGGSPVGNSRVKLTNAKDLVKRGLVAEGDNPLKVALSCKVFLASSLTYVFTSGTVTHWVPRLTFRVTFWPAFTVRPCLGFC